MSEANEQQFRSVAFGGFHKQDVLNYIETMVNNHTGKTEALQKSLSETEKAKAELERQVADTAKTLAETEKALAASVAELEKTVAEREEKTLALAEAGRRSTELEQRLKKAEPAAEAYEAVKEHTAGIELEAYRRAQDVLDEAAVQAEKARTELEQWIFKVQSGYDRLRTDVDATISHANGELGRVGKTLEGISEEFAAHDADLTNLLHVYHEAAALQAQQSPPVDKA